MDDDRTTTEADENARRWMQQWRVAAKELPLRKAAELAALTDEQALAATEALLSLATPPPERGSGLVEQQRLFQLWRSE